jgi:hypothetical protein
MPCPLLPSRRFGNNGPVKKRASPQGAGGAPSAGKGKFGACEWFRRQLLEKSQVFREVTLTLVAVAEKSCLSWHSLWVGRRRTSDNCVDW